MAGAVTRMHEHVEAEHDEIVRRVTSLLPHAEEVHDHLGVLATLYEKHAQSFFAEYRAVGQSTLGAKDIGMILKDAGFRDDDVRRELASVLVGAIDASGDGTGVSCKKNHAALHSRARRR